MATHVTLLWDGMRPAVFIGESEIERKGQRCELHLRRSLTISASEARQPATFAQPARPAVTTADIHYMPTCPEHDGDWYGIAAQATFFLDPRLLRHKGLQIRGEVVWIRLEKETVGQITAVRPGIIIHAGVSVCRGERIEIIPALPVTDPLFQHVVLVLRAASTVRDTSERLYVETLTNALVDHFFRRYVGTPQSNRAPGSGLPPYKLRQVAEYVATHLETTLALTELAKIAQMSPAYFARQFKQATGEAPHQYVIRRRVERAQQLLVETDLPLIAVGAEVGFSDQSHFIAVFRRQVGLTPKAYRENAQQTPSQV
jgi:AraC-like DNA-binding protein